MDSAQKFDYRIPYNLFNSLENELKCSICLEIFRDPHSTNCGHYFCKYSIPIAYLKANRECLTNYLKEMNNKCPCPLCKKMINKRELNEAPKLKAIADHMQRVVNGSTPIQPSGFSQSGTKKRKFNDFMQNSQDYTSKVTVTPKLNTLNSLTKETIQEEEAKVTIRTGELSIEQSTTVTKDRAWRSLPGKATIKPDMLNKTPENIFRGLSKEFDEHDSMHMNNNVASTTGKIRKNLNKPINLVTTALPHNMQEEVQKFCKRFKAKQTKDFNENITHMVIYPTVDNKSVIQAKRTVKYVLGVINGIWIVSFKWILNSLSNDEIQDEEDYETTEDFYGKGAPKFARLHGGLHSFFKGYSFFINDIDKDIKPSLQKNDLANIIEKAGGNVLKTVGKNTKNTLVISIRPADEDIEVKPTKKTSNKGSSLLSHKWILDSISNHKLLDFTSYFV